MMKNGILCQRAFLNHVEHSSHLLQQIQKIAGEFYAINNRGIFCSTDSGISWKMLEGIQWPKEYLSQHPWALVVREDT